MGGSKTAILAQVGHFYSDGVGQDKTGANNFRLCRHLKRDRTRWKADLFCGWDDGISGL
jgi:hypothetical protein